MTDHPNPLKVIAVDMLMLVIFITLISFSAWLVWMYFFRGPIDLDTRGYVTKTLKEISVQPMERGKYTLQHFHNLDEVVLKGIEYPSTCVSCHGDYPHNKNEKVRAFFNAHSWFIACETCHSDNSNQEKTIYKWLDNDTDIELYKLQGERGIYGARIVPVHINKGIEKFAGDIISQESVISYNKAKPQYTKEENQQAIDKMHEVLNEKPASCDNCHTENSMFNFETLLYSENMGSHLKFIDVGTMISNYQLFHLPDVLRPRYKDN